MRQDRIDYLKAFSAFFVVLGHGVSYASLGLYPAIDAVNRLIYSFHVPLFLLISGYLCHRQPFGNYVKNKLRFIIIPYLVFALLKLVYSSFVSQTYLHGTSVGECALRYFLFGEAYWFSYCIFFMLLLMYFFWEDGPPIKALLGCGLLTVFDIYLKLCGVSIFPSSVNVFGIFITEPFREFELLLHYFPYMLAGYVIRYYSRSLKAAFESKKFFLLNISAATAFAFTVLWATGVWKNFQALDFIPGCAMILLLYGLARALPEGIALFREAGMVSYQIMLLDCFFKVVLFGFAQKLGLPTLWILLPMALADIALSLLVCRIASKLPVASFLLGLKRNE